MAGYFSMKREEGSSILLLRDEARGKKSSTWDRRERPPLMCFVTSWDKYYFLARFHVEIHGTRCGS